MKYQNGPGNLSPEAVTAGDFASLSDCYLSHCLRVFAPSGANRHWPGLLSVLDCHDLIDFPKNTALVGSSLEIPHSISRFMAESVSQEILPALMRHQSIFEGDRALVYVAGPQELETMWKDKRAPVFPNTLTDLDTHALRESIGAKYESYAAQLERLTLYVVKVLDTYHHLIVVSGNLDPQIAKSAEFKHWQADIKKAHKCDLRLNYKPSKKLRIYSHSGDGERNNSSLKVDLQSSAYAIPASMSKGRFPDILSKITENWSSDTFVSIDDGKTLVREDIVSASFVNVNQLRVRIALNYSTPFEAGRRNAFVKGQEKLSLGTEFVIGANNKITQCRILPVITKNHKELLTIPVAEVLNRRLERKELAKEGKKIGPSLNWEVNSIENDPEVFNQISTLSIAASRIFKNRIGLGGTLEIPIGKEGGERFSQADSINSQILSMGQQMLTEWILCEHPGMPVLVLRPQYQFTSSFEKLRDHCPWVTEEQLQDLGQRRSLAEILSLKKDYLALDLLGETLLAARCRHRVVAIDSAEDMQEGDMSRFKHSRRGVLGLVGSAQVSSIFFGTPHYSMKQLQSYAQIMNLPLEERKGFDDALCVQVRNVWNKVGESWAEMTNKRI